jgi:hypothetical protein
VRETSRLRANRPAGQRADPVKASDGAETGPRALPLSRRFREQERQCPAWASIRIHMSNTQSPNPTP